MSWIETREDVDIFLHQMKSSLSESEDNLNILKRRKATDKTQKFMDEHGLQSRHILEELMKLDITNYSETDEDYEIKFPGDVWKFGQMYFSEKNRCYYEMYIKIKLVNGVVCMSFHPKEFDIHYPYNP